MRRILMGTSSHNILSLALAVHAKEKMEADPDYIEARKKRIKNRYRFIFLDRPYRPMFG